MAEVRAGLDDIQAKLHVYAQNQQRINTKMQDIEVRMQQIEQITDSRLYSVVEAFVRLQSRLEESPPPSRSWWRKS